MSNKDYPEWYNVALTQLDVKEIPGAKNNSIIMGYAKKLGGWIASWYKNDDIPWCGLFVAHCMREALPDTVIPKNPLGAKNWATYGRALKHGRIGAVLVFTRNGGGHVGFYVGETDTAFLVLGGNQSDKVCYAWISKERLVKGGIRWPKGFPISGHKVLYNKNGTLSTNEQ